MTPRFFVRYVRRTTLVCSCVGCTASSPHGSDEQHRPEDIAGDPGHQDPLRTRVDCLVATGCPPITRYSFDFGVLTISGTPRPAGTTAVAYSPRRTVLDRLLVLRVRLEVCRFLRREEACPEVRPDTRTPRTREQHSKQDRVEPQLPGRADRPHEWADEHDARYGIGLLDRRPTPPHPPPSTSQQPLPARRRARE
jgi:hypothetical protein